MNIHYKNREVVINRVKKELIGTGSDIFVCNDMQGFSDEVIGDKPLNRYFSAILFPRQLSTDGSPVLVDANDDDNEETSDSPPDLESTEGDDEEKEKIDKESQANKVSAAEDNRESYQYSNAFFPSQFGLSFCIDKKCPEIEIHLSFGNYKKAKYTEVALPYSGDSTHLIQEFGLSGFVLYDKERGVLQIAKETGKDENTQRDTHLKALKKEHKDTVLYKTLTKLFFKNKYKRNNNKIICNIPTNLLLNAEKQHLKINISELENVNTDTWHKKHKNNLLLHLKLYSNGSDKYFVKAVFENNYQHPKNQFALNKESLNAVCLFQTEIKVVSIFLLPFKDYKSNLYKSEEDKMLDYLYREKLAFGIGHNTACIWENSGTNSAQTNWISTTFLPEYDVKSQSTESDSIDSATLDIKKISSFSNNKAIIIHNLRQVASAYKAWIIAESEKANDNVLGLKNIEKCNAISDRITKGIDILAKNEKAFRAFQLANTAIYLQMFQSALNFDKKDGYAVKDVRMNPIQYDYEMYEIADYPSDRIPAWRPFQLAFILQCIPSFVEENCAETDLVDLLYFPTGGGKTEAYLAISAFLIFWRRLQYPTEYDGVNIIIRYTLRLLSAQQFERATKLILACEFMRKNHKDLGDKKITIGFWVGGSTIANKRDNAKSDYDKVLERLNQGKKSINPFQVSNCQWCNTKTIDINNTDKIGHNMLSKTTALKTYCLNPECIYCEKQGGLPIVLIDEDIYQYPPTMLFGTVDKFAQLAWKETATSLFNHKENRKPELIIQDELHLLNGPLGSLVGLFENIILALCTTKNQRPKVIASTATVKNVDKQILGLYGRKAQIFPQYATNADDTFFSKTENKSKRRYIGVLPTGKTSTMTNLRLNAALLYARLEVWQQSTDKTEADTFWTILSYFKSLKDIGRFANKIISELQPEIQQLQVRTLNNAGHLTRNYRKLPYRHLELTSRIANEKIKENLDKLDIAFDGNIEKHKAFDIVMATNMISVGLDVGRLGVMLMNGMPPNTAEYIQASSRVARKNEGVVFTLYDPNNTRDLSYFEDFVLFHKTFYKQVEPLSVTPFAENALDKMLFTVIVAYFRHKLGYAANNMATAIIVGENESALFKELEHIFVNHSFATDENKMLLIEKIKERIIAWKQKVEGSPANGLVYELKAEKIDKKRLLIPIQEKQSDEDLRIAMQSMRSVEPSVIIKLKKN